jgi:hypothetical protein
MDETTATRGHDVNEFPTFAEGDVLTHIRLLEGFEPETIPLADLGLSLHVQQDDEGTIHVLVVKD